MKCKCLSSWNPYRFRKKILAVSAERLEIMLELFFLPNVLKQKVNVWIFLLPQHLVAMCILSEPTQGSLGSKNVNAQSDKLSISGEKISIRGFDNLLVCRESIILNIKSVGKLCWLSHQWLTWCVEVFFLLKDNWELCSSFQMAAGSLGRIPCFCKRQKCH